MFATDPPKPNSSFGSECQFYLTKNFPAATQKRIVTKLNESGVPPFLGELDEYYETGMEQVGFAVFAREQYEQRRKDLGPLAEQLDKIEYPITMAELQAIEAKKALFGIAMNLYYQHLEEGDWIIVLDGEGEIIADMPVKFAVVQFKNLLGQPVFQEMPEGIEPDLWLKLVEGKAKVILFKAKTANPDSPSAHQLPLPPPSEQ